MTYTLTSSDSSRSVLNCIAHVVLVCVCGLIILFFFESCRDDVQYVKPLGKEHRVSSTIQHWYCLSPHSEK